MKDILWYNPSLKERAKKLRNHPTYTEKILWNSLKHDDLGYDFHRQKPVGYYIFDFFCKELKLVIELDGITHLEEDVKQNDLNKDEYIKGLGFKILRFKDEEVISNGSRVVQKIKDYIKEYESLTPSPALPHRKGERHNPALPRRKGEIKVKKRGSLP